MVIKLKWLLKSMRSGQLVKVYSDDVQTDEDGVKSNVLLYEGEAENFPLKLFSYLDSMVISVYEDHGQYEFERRIGITVHAIIGGVDE